MREIETKPCHGTVNRAAVWARVTELTKDTGGYQGSMQQDLVHEAEDYVTELHKARIAKCPVEIARKHYHPYSCECHWCCHDEKFDDNPEDCPECQKEIFVLRASADWSKCWLVSDNAKGICDTIVYDLEAMLDHPEDGGKVEITIESQTQLEWQLFLLNGNEFEGFQ